jgi:hypothetical protein
MMQKILSVALICATTTAVAPATADPARLEAIAGYLAGQIQGADAPDIASGGVSQNLAPTVPARGIDANTSADTTTSPVPVNLTELDAYVRAKTLDIPPRDLLTEACTLSATLNPKAPPPNACK